MPEKFDVIVVGAGMAGLSAACVMARAGLKVVVLERGDYPGGKNVMGGILYRQPTEEVFPEFWKTAPLERPIVEQNYWVMADEGVIKAGHRAAGWGDEPYNCFSVLRGKFDEWLGKQVAKEGALIVPGTTVTDVLKDGRGRAIGVRTSRPNGDLLANLVIIGDGATSLLGEKLGLHPKWTPTQVALAVKEVLHPPGNREERAKEIERRFGVGANEGVTIEMYGAVTKGMVGTGFLYTNKDSISFGVGALLGDFAEQLKNPHETLQRAKQHPAIAPLLADCEPREYLAHLIPEGGYNCIGQMYADGVMVVGDAAQLCNGLHREGSNLAITSGKVAGEIAVRAHDRGDFSVSTLREYEDRLRETYVMKDLLKYRGATAYMEKNRRMLGIYPDLINRMATEFLTVDSTSKWDKQWKLFWMADHKMRMAADMLGMLMVVK